MTARLHMLRELTGCERTGDDLPPAKPPFALREKIPGYDAHDIVIPSRDFR